MPLSWIAWGPVATPVWGRRGVIIPFFVSGTTLGNLDMDALALKFSVVQSLDGIHGLVRVGHVYKSKILNNSTLCDRAVFFKERTQLVIRSLLYICNVQFHGALVLPVTGLHVDWCAVKLVEVQVLDGFGGSLAVIHMDEGKVFDDGTLCDCTILGKECFDFILVCRSGQISDEDLHHV